MTRSYVRADAGSQTLQDLPPSSADEIRRMAKLAGLTVLPVNDAAQELTERLLREGIIPAEAADDAAHLGIAATNTRWISC